MSTLQDLIGSEGKASVFYVKLDDPANADAVVQEVKSVQGLESYSVRSMREYLSMMTVNSYPGLSTFINVVIGISVVIGFIVIFQAMYTAVMERTREIGILKSIGASKLYIVNVILRETVLLAIGGIVVGVLFSLAARAGIKYRLPTLPVVVTGGWICDPLASPLSGPSSAHCTPPTKRHRKIPSTRWHTSNDPVSSLSKLLLRLRRSGDRRTADVHRRKRTRDGAKH